MLDFCRTPGPLKFLLEAVVLRRPCSKHWVAAFALVLSLALGLALAGEPAVVDKPAGAPCNKPLYLTFDTGHMGVAPLIAQVLEEHHVRVTFFVADEPAQTGVSSLNPAWAPWWRARAQAGHQFASHTLDHVYWRADVPGSEPRFEVRPSAGPMAGHTSRMSAVQYCAQISAAGERLAQLTGKPSLPLFRAPGGKTSPALLAAAQHCGYRHVAWAPAGFLGDELPSDKFSNPYLLDKALRDIRSGDILMAHLGIWSRKEVWATGVLEPLIVGLKAKGFCFRTLRDHPDYAAWVADHPH
jgi:peptidoglycan/xylan/chitin deacetylase (PgdA/CDA1 family)